MNAFTIKDIENLSGIKAHTIRIWEQRYNFLKPQRTGTNIRYYSNNELKSILNIALLNRYGYKISHISKMNDDEINEKLFRLGNQQAIHEKTINDLIGYMIDLKMDNFEELINKQVQEKGIEKTIDETIFPFLEKIGILWLTSHINPAQEHLVTNLIRQKLLVGIENSPHPTKPKTALLFLPEGEHHELGLIYVNYLLRQSGVQVLYLGADVPMQDLQYVVKTKEPSFIYTHLTSTSHRFNTEKFFTNLHNVTSTIQAIASGPIATAYKKNIPANIQVMQSLGAVKDYIKNL